MDKQTVKASMDYRLLKPTATRCEETIEHGFTNQEAQNSY
ncbi:hypothetical protein GCM10011571_07060 [Marinithermofilum abyssi]|jgi:hypothetical protein|uniref:Uncharacterized protein n=1 Tax=Marinithermofilum abyssi TaxID=1571185 RepID=A0A8J2YCI3_9BACL|nr:hypothetical protein GCM10011571_07060 [Marinithermofilum abyssi]